MALAHLELMSQAVVEPIRAAGGDIAVASRVLAAGDLAGALGDFDLRRTATLHLRGIGRHKPISVREPRRDG